MPPRCTEHDLELGVALDPHHISEPRLSLPKYPRPHKAERRNDESANTPSAEKTALFLALGFVAPTHLDEVFHEITRTAFAGPLDWQQFRSTKTILLRALSQELPQFTQTRIDVGVEALLDVVKRKTRLDVPTHVHDTMRVPAPRPRLPLPNPHTGWKALLEPVRQQRTPHSLELESAQALTRSRDGEEANVVFSKVLNVEPDVFLSDKTGLLRTCIGAVILLKTRKGRARR